MGEKAYKLEELAKAAGTSPRTVRYYVQRGLLPPPVFKGKDSAYGEDHLVRLRAIKKLQEAYLPLDAIAAELEGRSVHEIEAIADGKVKPVLVSGNGGGSESASQSESGGGEDERSAVALQAWAVCRRIELFPGVELAVADDAPDQSVRLVKEMMAILEAMSRSKGREGGGRRR